MERKTTLRKLDQKRLIDQVFILPRELCLGRKAEKHKVGSSCQTTATFSFVQLSAVGWVINIGEEVKRFGNASKLRNRFSQGGQTPIPLQ